MFTTLFAIQCTLSAALAIIAVAVFARRGRRVAARSAFAAALAGFGDAFTMPGHRHFWTSATLLAYAAAFLVGAVVVAVRRTRDAEASS